MEIKRYPIKEMKIKIKDLHELYRNGFLILNPEFQRSYVWEKMRDKRERLIDSLLREFDIGKIFLREEIKIIEGKPVVTYECLDGQQRLRSIFDFIEEGYPTSKRITRELGDSKTFDELETKHQISITDRWLEPVVVESDDDEMISDIFLRLQEGVPLRGPEKLNAERGIMRNKMVELSKHKFFEKTGVSPYRFAYRYLVAQIMRLEEQRVLQTLNFVNVGYNELRRMYRNYRDEETKVKHLTNKINTNLNFQSRVLDRDAKVIWSKGDIVSIYLLTSYVRDKFAISGKEDKFQEFIMNFLENVENTHTARDRRTEENAPYYDYKEKRRRSTTSGSMIRERFEILLQEFLKYIHDLRLKDEKRLFDWGQKLAIYNRQKGNCKGCGEPVENIREAEFHHRDPYEKGGPTTVENGEMYHPRCHPR